MAYCVTVDCIVEQYRIRTLTAARAFDVTDASDGHKTKKAQAPTTRRGTACAVGRECPRECPCCYYQTIAPLFLASVPDRDACRSPGLGAMVQLIIPRAKRQRRQQLIGAVIVTIDPDLVKDRQTTDRPHSRPVDESDVERIHTAAPIPQQVPSWIVKAVDRRGDRTTKASS